MKIYLFLFVLLLSLQACSVYHSKPVSVQKAVAANSRVKVTTEDHQQYKFKRLEQGDDHLIGVTKVRSKTAKKLRELPAENAGKFVKVDLSALSLEEIKLRNNTLSTIINIAIPAVVAFATLFVVYITSVPPLY